MDLLEQVQHNSANRRVQGLDKLDYEVRLEKMDLSFLTFRRARGDTIEEYKYLYEIYTVDSSYMLPLAEQTELLPEDTASNYRKRQLRIQLRMNFLGCVRLTVGNNCQKELHEPP